MISFGNRDGVTGGGGKSAFTLVELLAVVTILLVVALIAVPRVSRIGDRAKALAAEHDLKALAAAFTNDGNGYLADMEGIPGFSPATLRIANLMISTNLYGTVNGDARHDVSVRVDDPTHTDAWCRQHACARPEVFTRWSPEAHHGWRGPYAKGEEGRFPAADERRFHDDATAKARGFYPDVSGLRVAEDFRNGLGGCSIYGFPGEAAMMDPWKNPYVLQVPPPQAFSDAATNMPDRARFRFARIVSAGPNGILETPCYAVNKTNIWATAWNEERRRMSRQAGRLGADVSSRGDDFVYFLFRSDVDE